MKPLRLPPKIKVLEALGALADGRVRLGDGRAEVVSSEGDRVYEVCVDLERGLADSTDNGTKFRGYVGYPIIAVLMALGALPFDREVAEALRGVPWRKLNEKYKKYSKVMEVVLEEAEKKGVSRERVLSLVDEVMKKLKELGLKKGCHL
ncbi:hypothetical protein [Ignicoccus hospitalis]|uniref:Uncharacterized protein n=1 Tax=Ignicoccus hospitalis (strain KIN4/I / DSM 18386 / JCM 14125) TaxID=453591 RepID=A8ABR3_IGNH4|nr:hypothetical protein [Ignicoccus hospitalis]ABU82365.1 hypothetical protein Igni_1188 [Ignicoccus hospitalis KIN4/I]HIH90839.1 hypothetical protein [Desulfurococcaceae archaeon]